MWQLKTTCILGLWLFISGHIPELQSTINMTITGAMVALLAIYKHNKWQGVVNGVLGIWLILCGLIFGIVPPFNFFVIGLLIAIVGLTCFVDEEKIPNVKKYYTSEKPTYFDKRLGN